MKKTIKIIFAVLMTFMVFPVMAQTLPEDFEAYLSGIKKNETEIITEAKVSFSFPIALKYGTVNVKPKSNITFYENGKLKSFMTDETIELTESYGTIVISSALDTYRNEVPIVLYEDGSIKSACVPTLSSKEAKTKDQVSLPCGKYSIVPQSRISFHPDGSLETFKVSNGSTILFDGQTIQLVLSTITLHENGNIKEFTPKNSMTLNGITSYAKKPVAFYDDGKIQSFYPAKDQGIKIGNVICAFVSGEPIEYYHDGIFKSYCIDITGKDVEIFGIKLYCATPKAILNDEDSKADEATRPHKIQIVYHENGVLQSIRTLQSSAVVMDFPPSFMRIKEIKLYDNSSIESIQFDPSVLLGAVDDRKFYAWKFIFNKNNINVARVGILQKGSGRQFTDKSGSCILLYSEDGQTVTDIITDNDMDGGITADTDVILDDNGKPVSYTVKASYGITYTEEDKKIITKPIK